MYVTGVHIHSIQTCITNSNCNKKVQQRGNAGDYRETDLSTFYDIWKQSEKLAKTCLQYFDIPGFITAGKLTYSFASHDFIEQLHTPARSLSIAPKHLQTTPVGGIGRTLTSLPTGRFNSIGVFLWATDSEMARRVNAYEPPDVQDSSSSLYSSL